MIRRIFAKRSSRHSNVQERPSKRPTTAHGDDLLEWTFEKLLADMKKTEQKSSSSLSLSCQVPPPKALPSTSKKAIIIQEPEKPSPPPSLLVEEDPVQDLDEINEQMDLAATQAKAKGHVPRGSVYKPLPGLPFSSGTPIEESSTQRTLDSLLLKREREIRTLRQQLIKEQAKRRRSEGLRKVCQAAAQKRAQAVMKELQQKDTQLQKLTLEVRALKDRLSRASSSSGSSTWQFQQHHDWIPFAADANAQMDRAFQAWHEHGQRFVQIVSCGISRTVDFQLMQQVNLDTKKKRRIRLDLGVPNGWNTDRYLLRQQTNSSPFYVEVTDTRTLNYVQQILTEPLDHCTCVSLASARLISLHRIENFHLWQLYSTRREMMRKAHARAELQVEEAPFNAKNFLGHPDTQSAFCCQEPLEAGLNEKILLHGTSYENAHSIIMHGFDPRVTARGLYGGGVYFAASACKSHQYTCQQHKPWSGYSKGCACKTKRTVILARVAVGDAHHATETVKRTDRRPPARDLFERYDSTVADAGPMTNHSSGWQTHQEFVVFTQEQAYPAFVAQYVLS